MDLSMHVNYDKSLNFYNTGVSMHELSCLKLVAHGGHPVGFERFYSSEEPL